MKISLLILLITCTSYRITFPQNDSIHDLINEEYKDLRNNRFYKLFLVDRDKEISHLWKFDLIHFGLLQPNIGFEQRIGKKWSSNTVFSGGFLYQDLELSYTMGEFEHKEYPFYLNETQEIRFYYNFLRRKQLGKRINGFSGNYFALSISAFHELGNPGFKLNSGINYGLQRRIGNIGFIEAYVGIISSYSYHKISYDSNRRGDYITYENWEYTFNLGIKAGFAIDSSKKTN